MGSSTWDLWDQAIQYREKKKCELDGTEVIVKS